MYLSAPWKFRRKTVMKVVLQRLLETKQKKYDNYIEELEKVTGLSWTFAYPEDDSAVELFSAPKDSGTFIRILDFILRAHWILPFAVYRLSEVEGHMQFVPKIMWRLFRVKFRI